MDTKEDTLSKPQLPLLPLVCCVRAHVCEIARHSSLISCIADAPAAEDELDVLTRRAEELRWMDEEGISRLCHTQERVCYAQLLAIVVL